MAFFCTACNVPFTDEEARTGECPYCHGALMQKRVSPGRNATPSMAVTDAPLQKRPPAQTFGNQLDAVKRFLKQWVEKVLVSRLPRRPSLAYFLVALGWILYFPALAAMLVSGLVFIISLKGGEWELALWAALAIMGSSACIGTSVWCRTIGWRILAGRANVGLGDDVRPHILYLRPFQFDRSWAPQDPFKMPSTYEEHFARVLGRFGPFVAIGRPDEPLPELGASRLYVEHSLWQERVKELMEGAAAVLLTMGDSAGLKLELEHAVSIAGPDRLLLFVPFGSDPNPKAQLSARQSAYDRFRLWAQDVLPMGLPEQIGDSCFIYFARDWTPVLLPPPQVTFLFGFKHVPVEISNTVLRPLLRSLQQDRLFLRPMQVPMLARWALLVTVLTVLVSIFFLNIPVILGIPMLVLLTVGISLAIMAAQKKL
jgi:hypothetical protein